MYDRRTKAQQNFDLAARGWAFSNTQMLKDQLLRLEEMAKTLQPSDHRHELIETIRAKSQGPNQ